MRKKIKISLDVKFQFTENMNLYKTSAPRSYGYPPNKLKDGITDGRKVGRTNQLGEVAPRLKIYF